MADKVLKRISCFAVFFSILIGACATAENNVYAAPSVSAESAVVINAVTGEILYEKNCHKQHYPASCTKVMTGLLAVEYGQWDEQITMSHEAIWGIDRDSSNIALDVGEVVSFEQLMYGMMLASGNECAAAIAETVGGSVEQFAELMNERAKELGANDTNFVNPHGLFQKEHVTTAYDIAIIMREAVSHAKFVEVINTTQYSIPPTNKQKETRIFNNTHQMLPKRSYYYEAVIGGKTGWVPESGNNLVTYAERNGIKLITVTFGEHGAATGYKDTANLLDYFFDNYEIRTLLVSEYINTEDLGVELSSAGEVKTSCDERIEVLLEKGADISKLQCSVSPDNSVELPITEGQRVAGVDFILDGKLLGTVNVYASENMYVRSDEPISDNIPASDHNVNIKKDGKSVFGKVLAVIGYILLVLVLLLVLLVIILMMIRRRNIRIMQRRRAARLHSAGRTVARKPSAYRPSAPYEKRRK